MGDWKPIESAEVEQYEPNPRLLVVDEWGNLYIAQYAPNNCGDGSYSWFAEMSNGNHCNEIEPVSCMPLPPHRQERIMNETEKQIVAWLGKEARQQEGNGYPLSAMVYRNIAKELRRGDHRQHSPAKDD